MDQYGSAKAMQCLKQQTQDDWLLSNTVQLGIFGTDF
jgi:hypothetical protein